MTLGNYKTVRYFFANWSFLYWWSILTFTFVVSYSMRDVTLVTKCKACLFLTQISKCNIDMLKQSYALDDFMLSTFLASACWIWNSMKGKLCSRKFCLEWMMFTHVTQGLLTCSRSTLCVPSSHSSVTKGNQIVFCPVEWQVNCFTPLSSKRINQQISFLLRKPSTSTRRIQHWYLLNALINVVNERHRWFTLFVFAV